MAMRKRLTALSSPFTYSKYSAMKTMAEFRLIKRPTITSYVGRTEPLIRVLGRLLNNFPIGILSGYLTIYKLPQVTTPHF